MNAAPAPGTSRARLARACAESGLIVAATLFAWPLAFVAPALAVALAVSAIGAIAWTVVAALRAAPPAQTALRAANDNAPWPPRRARAGAGRRAAG